MCDAETIYGGVEAFGGKYELSFNNQVTHVVALKDPMDTLDEVHNSKFKCILPHYFDDCFRLLMKCPEENYLFPDPKVFDYPLNLAASCAQLSTPNTLEEKFLAGQMIFFADDLGDVDRAQLLCAGAQIASQFSDQVTLCIMELAIPLLVNECKKSKIFYGTWRWLSDMLATKTVTSPALRVLHKVLILILAIPSYSIRIHEIYQNLYHQLHWTSS